MLDACDLFLFSKALLLYPNKEVRLLKASLHHYTTILNAKEKTTCQEDAGYATHCAGNVNPLQKSLEIVPRVAPARYLIVLKSVRERRFYARNVGKI